jgi:hypothetical protein
MTTATLSDQVEALRARIFTVDLDDLQEAATYLSPEKRQEMIAIGRTIDREDPPDEVVYPMLQTFWTLAADAFALRTLRYLSGLPFKKWYLQMYF